MAAVIDVLAEGTDGVLDAAADALQRSNETHYTAAGPQVSRERLAMLLELVLDSIRQRDLGPMIDHARQVANERFDAGFDIREVQRAFHVLEEAIWDLVVAQTPPNQLAESLGMVGTVLGAGRDVLARTYVERAAQQHVASLDLSALFRGGT